MSKSIFSLKTKYSLLRWFKISLLTICSISYFLIIEWYNFLCLFFWEITLVNLNTNFTTLEDSACNSQPKMFMSYTPKSIQVLDLLSPRLLSCIMLNSPLVILESAGKIVQYSSLSYLVNYLNWYDDVFAYMQVTSSYKLYIEFKSCYLWNHYCIVMLFSSEILLVVYEITSIIKLRTSVILIRA